MMRLARRASLLVAFYVLASAASASAECAWMLWRGHSDDSWGIPDAYATKAACLEEMERQLDHSARHYSTITMLRADRTWFWKMPIGDGRFKTLSTTLYCLPDTIDPRGPKGK